MSFFGDRLGEPVFKQSSERELWVKRGDAFARFSTFPIRTWSGALGPGLREGEDQSPTNGAYVVQSPGSAAR